MQTNKPAIIEEYKVPKGIVDLNQVSILLLEQMKEVKQNPAAIPQAASMAEIAGRMVEISLAQVKQGQMVVDLLKVKQNSGE